MERRKKRVTQEFDQEDYDFSSGRRRRNAAGGNRWIPVVCIVMVFAVLVALYFAEEKSRLAQNDAVLRETVQEEESVPLIDQMILLCSDTAKQLYDGQMDIQTAIQTEDPYRPLVIEYDVGPDTGTLLISEDRSFIDASEYAMEAFTTVFRVDNLKTGTTYYYRMTIGEETYSGSFWTEESTRFVSIPGTQNTRDIGGYRNQDGKLVKQGLLIRGTELDGLEYASYKLPETAVERVQETFGFVYDFDLRSRTIYEGDYQSPLGSDVGHAFYTAPQYEQIFESEWISTVRTIFEDLADPKKYPMYMHCTWGKDRTGTIVYLLQGVLNMSEEDMMREYMLSGFVHTEMEEKAHLDQVIQELQKYDGGTLQEKIVTYLTTDVGVAAETLDSIRSIFLAG